MAYLTELKWMKNLSDYNTTTQKVLLVLSHEKFKWRTKDKISSKSGLSKDEIEDVLAKLLSLDIIRASFSKKKNLIFGLRERVN